MIIFLTLGIRFPGVHFPFINLIRNHWDKLITYRKKINRYFYLYTLGITLVSFPLFLFKISRYVIAVVFASMGILSSEVLSSYYYLKEAAKTVLNFFSIHTPITFEDGPFNDGKIVCFPEVDASKLNLPEHVVPDEGTNNDDSNNSFTNKYLVISLISVLGLVTVVRCRT